MALNYRPVSEEEILMSSVLPAGQYEFVIDKITEEKSKGGTDKNGNPKKIFDMLVVELRIYNSAGAERKIKDWVILDDEVMAFKFRHLASTLGMLDKYESKTLTIQDLVGKHGVVKLGIKDFIDQYGEPKKSNGVVDYMKRASPANDLHVEPGFIDSDIPDFK